MDTRFLLVFPLATVAGLALAQPAQVVTPPVARYWMSVETAAGMSMPAMGAGASVMGGMMGGQGQAGRRMVLQLGSQNAAEPPRAQHDIPPGLQMGPMLPLVTPLRPKAEARERAPYERERPKGRMLIYWGCGEATRPGQPVVLDFARLAEGQTPPNMLPPRRIAGQIPPAPGRVRTYGDWPNEQDAKRVSDAASLRGEHVVKGNYSPEIRFTLDDDFMAPVALASAPRGAGAASVTWSRVAGATGYFATVFGAASEEQVVFWSSSEVQEMGSTLMDYVPPVEVARLVRDKVVLAPSTTECTVPAEVVQKAGGTPMMSFIAYGPEANFAQPPRPADARIPWEVVWTAKVRFKSTAMLLLGESSQPERRVRRERDAEPAPERPSSAPRAPAEPDPVKEGINILRGILGR